MGSASIGDSNILPELCAPPSQILLLSPSHAFATQPAAGYWWHLTCTNFSICLSYIEASYKKTATVLCLQSIHLCSLQVSSFSNLPTLSCSSRSSSCHAMYTAVHRWHSFSFKTRKSCHRHQQKFKLEVLLAIKKTTKEWSWAAWGVFQYSSTIRWALMEATKTLSVPGAPNTFSFSTSSSPGVCHQQRTGASGVGYLSSAKFSNVKNKAISTSPPFTGSQTG